MPNTLDVRADGRQLRFHDNFQLEEIDAAGAVARRTTWEADSSPTLNTFSFKFGDETITSLVVTYAFNELNQLIVKVPKQSGVAAKAGPWTLPGRILVKDTKAVEYVVIDAKGNPVGTEGDPAALKERIIVHAELSFSEDHSQLEATFADKSTTAITGIGAAGDNLATQEYGAGGDLTRDLLAFQAVTTNQIGGKDRDFPADIKFYGRWDLHENSLVFVTHYDNTGGSPLGYIALGGEIGGTNFGLLLKQDGEVVLKIAGKYAWNKNTLGWDLAVGYSKAAGLEARFKADGVIETKNGKLTFGGGATLKKGPQGTDLDLNLSLDYTSASKNIVFTLNFDGGSYEVKLSGDFKITNGEVKFNISATNKDGKPVVTGTVELGFFTKNSNLKAALEAVLTPNGLKLVLDMKFSFYWGPSGPVAALP